MNVFNFPYQGPIIHLVGPTAVGKTSLSIKIAETFGCEIIGVDSMQIYRYMDIGTAKITDEEKCGIPHHLIDIINPDEVYDAGRFVKDSCSIITEINNRGKIPLLTGGTGMYFTALLYGLSDTISVTEEVREKVKKKFDEQGRKTLFAELESVDKKTSRRIHINDTHRLMRALEIYYETGKPWSFWIDKQKQQKSEPRFPLSVSIFLELPRKILYERINYRCSYMIDQGFQGEVESLLSMGYGPNLHSMKSIGYKHMIEYVLKKTTYNEMLETMQKDTRRYAKRQFTWFKKMKGFSCYTPDSHKEIVKHIEKKLNKAR